jgi:multisubunit Na+/H+ antiporter MnhB subunit
VLCCALYVVLAVAMFGHFDFLGSSHLTGTGNTDAIEQVWWLAWPAFALPHGYNAFFSQWQNYPAGENFGVNGSMLVLGTIFIPITKLFGPVVTWNILVRLALAVSASSMCLVLRRWTTWWPAAFVGGLLYGFSAYFAYDALLFLSFAPLPPVIFLMLYEILVRQRWRPGRTGAVLGVICALQFFIWSEVLASTVVMGIIAVILFVLVCRHDLAERWKYAMTALGTSVAVGGLLLLFPVLYTLTGPQGIRGAPSSTAQHPSDLFGAIVPSYQWLSTNQLTTIAQDRLAESAPLYLGLPLLVALVAFAVFLRRNRLLLMAGAMALISFVLSLGPRLWINGHETSIPLPFALFEHLPILDGFVPSRFSLYTALFTAGMFALGLDELRRRVKQSGWPAVLSPRWRSVVAVAALIALAAAVLLPFVPRHTEPATKTNIPSYFTSAALASIPPGSVVLAYPYPDLAAGLFFQHSHDIMIDQAVSGMHFKLIGGYGWFPSSSGHSGTAEPPVLEPRSVQGIFDASYYADATASMAPLLASNVSALRVFLHKYDVETVLVLPEGAAPAAVAAYVTAAIGPPVTTGGLKAWFHVSQRLRSPHSHLGAVAPGGVPSHFVAQMANPAEGARISGTEILDAETRASYFQVNTVAFSLTGGSLDDYPIATGQLNLAASLRPTNSVSRPTVTWSVPWNSASVPNGTYRLQCVASDAGGHTSRCPSITISIHI